VAVRIYEKNKRHANLLVYRPVRMSIGFGVRVNRLPIGDNPNLGLTWGASCYTIGRSVPDLKPGTVRVCGMRGLKKGMHTSQHPPPPASRAWTDPPINVQAVSRAVRYVNTHRPRFQIRARPSYIVVHPSLSFYLHIHVYMHIDIYRYDYLYIYLDLYRG